MSSLINLPPDTRLQARLEEMSKLAREEAAAHQKSADETPSHSSRRCTFQILANNAKLDEHELELLAHAVGAGYTISVSPSLYERIFP
jgi:hypothetical protein